MALRARFSPIRVRPSSESPRNLSLAVPAAFLQEAAGFFIVLHQVDPTPAASLLRPPPRFTSTAQPGSLNNDAARRGAVDRALGSGSSPTALSPVRGRTTLCAYGRSCRIRHDGAQPAVLARPVSPSAGAALCDLLSLRRHRVRDHEFVFCRAVLTGPGDRSPTDRHRASGARSFSAPRRSRQSDTVQCILGTYSVTWFRQWRFLSE